MSAAVSGSGGSTRVADVALTPPPPGTIRVVHNPPEADLEALGVRSWDTWESDVTNMPMTYEHNATCYLLKGEATVTPDGSEEGKSLKAGDMASFPKGISLTWKVTQAVKKHYKFFD